MRGKIREQRFHDVLLRITPAYAGKNEEIMCVEVKSEDHPRLCGEKSVPRWVAKKTKGSPPPMRGKIIKKWDYLRTQRITPAYAGKKVHQKILSFLSQDHPRLCGEKSRNISQVLIMQGSPPPMRGKTIHQAPA